ncbi:hypothetical protein DV515_00014869 [Chloebia gouldiae]|uniref:Peptidase A2 domain-containing protein n=1 Tax=Chloebia gouldiae TaxID=44316 RepID=A0A3L8RYG5_CHLGU|nr:hypothetical protein DV515_00014869 [Chloebia gouldiae]
MLGLFVLPEVIDADFKGEIMIMVHTPFPPLCIMKEQKIAQLVPLEQMTKTLVKGNLPERGEKGFASTGGLTLLTVNLHDHPKQEIKIEYQGQRKTLMSLLDMGADSSIISPEQWPNDWPLMLTATTVTGIGGLQLANQTPLLKSTIDGKRISATFSVVTLPPTVQWPQISDIKATLAQASLTIAPEKIQLSSPWKYLGWVISEQHIKPQKVQLHMDIQTLNDAQKLLGDLQWLRPIVTDLTHCVHVSSEQRDALEKILDCVTQGQEHSGYLPDGLNPSSMQKLPLRLTADARERIRTKASLTLLPQLLQLKGYNKHLDQRIHLSPEDVDTHAYPCPQLISWCGPRISPESGSLIN